MRSAPAVESRSGSESDAPGLNAEPSPERLRRRRRRLWLFRLVTLSLLLLGQEALFRFLFPFPEVIGFNRIHYSQMAPSHPRLGSAWSEVWFTIACC